MSHSKPKLGTWPMCLLSNDRFWRKADIAEAMRCPKMNSQR